MSAFSLGIRNISMFISIVSTLSTCRVNNEKKASSVAKSNTEWLLYIHMPLIDK